jgi:Flp pilus assembly protein TadB
MCDPTSEDNNLKKVWQSQPTEGVRMSVAEVQAKASVFHNTIRWRNIREYVASAIVVLFFGYRFIETTDPFSRAGMALIIAGTCYLVWQLHRRGSAHGLPKEAGLSSFIDFQRSQLIRQRDMLTHIWRWYLGPLVPGLVITIVAIGRASQRHSPYVWPQTVLNLGIVLAVFLGIAWLNKRAARRLQRQIDELDEASR